MPSRFRWTTFDLTDTFPPEWQRDVLMVAADADFRNFPRTPVLSREGPDVSYITQIHPMPPDTRHPSTPWPMWPLQLRMEAAHEEGGVREWSVLTTHFSGDENGNVRKLHCVRVGPKPALVRVPDSEFYLDADLVLIAIGFSGPVRKGLLEQLPIALDARGNIKADATYMTSVPGVFSAGDAHRGQSLVVWAIADGRKAAHYIDRYLTGSSQLPV
jgi:glutamate synthase (NADPH) small chain